MSAKREASPEVNQSEEVCKRLKEENKESEAALSKAAGEGDKLDGSKTNNSSNNNNSTNNNNNTDANENKTSNGSKVESETNGAKKEDGEPTVAAETKATDDVKNTEDKKPIESASETTTTTTAEPKEKESGEESKTKGESDEKTETKSETPEPEEEPTGTLLICGGANWDMTGRKELPKTAKKPVEVHPGARSLWGPHRVQVEGYEGPLRVKGVFSGCNACHSVIVTDEGVTMTFGRNDKGQLGLGDTETRTTPCVVEALDGINIVAAACGRSHTLFLSSDGIVFSCGDNKMGQCGTNQMAVQQIVSPTRIAFKENKPVVKVACGAEFSMIVDIEGRLYSFGHPEHGQLGHNSEGKYFTTGNKYAFHCEYQPRRIVTFIEKSREGHVTPVEGVSIVDVACGTNHTLAVDKRHRCFSWGFAGYHRLGHSETKNELVPRSIKVFDAPPNSGRGASRVFAGASHSLALDVNGLLYFWGQNKSSGEATMYPKNVQDLCGWRIRTMSSGNRSIFVIADESCISWGPSPTYGELGYGEGKSKSSTIPQEVKTLEDVHVMEVACGFGHTLLIARDSGSADKEALDKFNSWP